MNRNAYVLFNCDEDPYGEKITNKVCQISMRMINGLKKRFVEEGFEACLE